MAFMLPKPILKITIPPNPVILYNIVSKGEKYLLWDQEFIS
jgi:hypothetical protein